MPTVDSIRQQYPQYHDLSDQQLVDALHARYYKDMPTAQFYKQVGYQPTSTGADVAKSIWGGLVSGAAGLTDQLNPEAIMGDTARVVAGLTKSPKLQAFLDKYVPPSTVQQGSAQVGGNYVPQTTPGRYAHAVAQMAPNAVTGGTGVIPRVAAVALPALASQGASDAAAAMGLGPKWQAGARFVGGLAGGLGAGGVNAGANGADLAPQIITQAEAPVALKIAKALAVDGTTPSEAIQATSGGKLPAVATPGLSQLAENVATQPGVGSIRLADAAGARMSNVRERALNAVTAHLGVDPESAQGDVNAIVKNGQNAVGPGYDALRANPAPVWNPRLAVLAQTPAVKKAIGVVTDSMLNDPDGPSPTAAGFQIDPDTGSWVLPKSGSLEGITEQQPTAATWIRVHQALGQTVERNPLTGAVIPDSLSPGNYNIAKVGGYLGDALAGDENGEGAAIPGYRDLLDQAGDYASVRGAFNRASSATKGPGIFSGTVNDFNNMWGSLRTPAEVQAGQAAIANDILGKSEGNQFLPGQFKSEGVQQKLATAFGDDSAQNFTDQMEGDIAERNAYNRILANSATARRTAGAADFNAPPPPSLASNLLKNSVGLAKYGTAIVNPHLWPMIPMMAASDLINSRQAAQAAVQTSPETTAQLGGILSDPGAFSTFLAKMSAQEAANAQAQASGQQGALAGFAGAAPGLLSAVLAP